MIRHGLAWVGTGTVAAGVAGYWAYTLGGQIWLAPWLERRRRVLMSAGLLGAGAAIPCPSGLVPLGISAALYGYAAKRQWLFPETAPEAQPSACSLGAEEWVVQVPGGGLLPLRWAARRRTVWMPTDGGRLLVVYCALARSLSVLSGANGRVAAVLPHESGFYIGNGTSRWDGGSGTHVGGQAVTLERVRFTVARYGALPAPAAVYTPNGVSRLPEPLHKTPRVPGARGVADAMRWGTVERGQWFPLDADVLESDWMLCRWAARVRGAV